MSLFWLLYTRTTPSLQHTLARNVAFHFITWPLQAVVRRLLKFAQPCGMRLTSSCSQCLPSCGNADPGASC